MSSIDECDQKLPFYGDIFSSLKIITFLSLGICFITLLIERLHIYSFWTGCISFISLILLFVCMIVILALTYNPFPFGIMKFGTICEILNSIFSIVELCVFIVGIVFLLGFYFMSKEENNTEEYSLL